MASTATVRIERLDDRFRLTAETTLTGSPADVFPFFADPGNLEKITPPWLRFRIVSSPPTIVDGTTIVYRLRLHGLPITWRTEITGWEPPVRFVDTQRRGPFRLWVHEHTFEAADGGTLMRDRVDYGMFLGRIANRLLVARDLEAIFRHRHAVIAELLGAGEDEASTRRP